MRVLVPKTQLEGSLASILQKAAAVLFSFILKEPVRNKLKMRDVLHQHLSSKEVKKASCKLTSGG